ncbi:hypothetical protein MgSA37_01559 [Mucilaginibacter gotjawali]|uniref:Uncharacterized protein n=2 Tax=Mucilaginibacter gotjawali TaxID=1550579 RepID=A0A0X8X044_9SPHI|nr:hypothetical protein [Mucilaginibacter gotjawali]BAU53392.1 hypothetical protein MgSA37_01559 [Mucilaginibacter gotjawali]
MVLKSKILLFDEKMLFFLDKLMIYTRRFSWFISMSIVLINLFKYKVTPFKASGLYLIAIICIIWQIIV